MLYWGIRLILNTKINNGASGGCKIKGFDLNFNPVQLKKDQGDATNDTGMG